MASKRCGRSNSWSLDFGSQPEESSVEKRRIGSHHHQFGPQKSHTTAIKGETPVAPADAHFFLELVASGCKLSTPACIKEAAQLPRWPLHELRLRLTVRILWVGPIAKLGSSPSPRDCSSSITADVAITGWSYGRQFLWPAALVLAQEARRRTRCRQIGSLCARGRGEADIGCLGITGDALRLLSYKPKQAGSGERLLLSCFDDAHVDDLFRSEDPPLPGKCGCDTAQRMNAKRG